MSLWRHQVETFSALLSLCAGNSPVTGEFPSQRPVTRSFDVSFICAWIDGWVNNREAGDLGRHRAHYDVIVMDSLVAGPYATQSNVNHINCAVYVNTMLLWRFTKEARAHRDPYDHIPFGYGPRNCIAMRLALMEVKMAAAMLLKHFTFLCSAKSPVGHDDVIKWKHFPRYWPFVRGIHRSPVNSPHKGQ